MKTHYLAAICNHCYIVEPENLVRIYLNSWVSDLLSPISSTGESIILIAFEPTAAGVKQALKDTFGVHKERVQMEVY